MDSRRDFVVVIVCCCCWSRAEVLQREIVLTGFYRFSMRAIFSISRRANSLSNQPGPFFIHQQEESNRHYHHPFC